MSLYNGMTPEPTVLSTIAAWLIGIGIIIGGIVAAAFFEKFLDLCDDPEKIFRDFFAKK